MPTETATPAPRRAPISDLLILADRVAALEDAIARLQREVHELRAQVEADRNG